MEGRKEGRKEGGKEGRKEDKPKGCSFSIINRLGYGTATFALCRNQATHASLADHVLLIH
jgi:hypothetical protein